MDQQFNLPLEDESLDIEEEENAFDVSKSLEIKKLEIQAIEEADKVLEIYEAEVFSTRQFDKMQKYLSCITKKTYPNENFP